MADDSRISPYNLSDCKNTTDDALANYLNSLPSISQSHTHTDTKLLLGYTAVLISAATFLYDRHYGFEATKNFTLGAVILYFALNAAFTYCIWAVEKNVVYTGQYKGRKVVVSARVDKYDPTYRVVVRYGNGEKVEIEAPFMKWFTSDGVFVAEPFQRWLAGSVKVIGDADPKNALQSGQGEPDTAQASGVVDGAAGAGAGKGAKTKVSKRK